jgi:phosphoglycolate phosphatase
LGAAEAAEGAIIGGTTAPGARAVLFDLDGTLVETRDDIATAVNLVLRERKLPPMSVEAVSEHVGRGARVLVTRCLVAAGVAGPTEEQIQDAYGTFARAYADHLLDTSYVYAGVPALLERLARPGCALAIVSNKPEGLSRQLIDGLGLLGSFRLIVGGDTFDVRKPDPRPLLYTLEKLGAGAGEAAMVGDSVVDVEAARAAGMAAAAVTWGFGARGALAAAQPDFLAETPEELGEWLEGGR